MNLTAIIGAVVLGVVLALGGYTWWLRGELDTVKANNAVLSSAAETNQQTINALRDKAAERERINLELTAKREELARRLSQARRDTRNALSKLSEADRNCLANTPLPAEWLQPPRGEGNGDGGGVPGESSDSTSSGT